MTLQDAPISITDLARFAPPSDASFIDDSFRSNAKTGDELFFARLSAIGRPMLPRPINPIDDGAPNDDVDDDDTVRLADTIIHLAEA
jgi:hypothetical protein